MTTNREIARLYAKRNALGIVLCVIAIAIYFVALI